MEQAMKHDCRRSRNKFIRAFDLLTMRAVQGRLPDNANWLLNTSATFLSKSPDTEDRDEDGEWL